MLDLSELNEPLLDFTERLRKTGLATAKQMYGVDGACAHHNSDLWADSLPVDNYVSATWWPSGLGWLAIHVFEHYAYTGDVEVLREYYPVLRDAAKFYLGFMTEYKGWKVTNPSMSPESMYFIPGTTEALSITLGPTMDNSLVWALIGMVIECHHILGIENEEELATKLRELRQQLPPLRINAKGGVMEWIEDYEEEEPGHRHWSHLFGLYPAAQITPGVKDIFEAAKKSVRHRLDNGGGYTGWSRAWTIALAARALDPQEVENSLLVLLKEYTHTSLLDTGPPSDFQADGNFGGTAGVAEALLQSHEQIAREVSSENPDHLTEVFVGNALEKDPLIRLLPALPAGWAANGGGKVTGLMSRGGFEVDIIWDDQANLKSAIITSLLGGQVWVTAGKAGIGEKSENEIVVTGGLTGGFVLLKTKKGEKYEVTLKV